MADTSHTFESPVQLTDEHDLAQFTSGEPALDDWLQQRALKNMKIGATKTYVLCAPESLTVIGYYAICASHIVSTDVTSSMRRNMPNQIPGILLGRLAIDTTWQGQGLGSRLLRDVVMRCKRSSREIGARLIIVHAISDEAEKFYRHYGFTRLPVESPTLALDITKLQ